MNTLRRSSYWTPLLMLGLLMAPSARATEPFQLEQWLKVIDARHPKSIGDAIALLPAELRQNYVLAYNSLSAQSSSEDKPRAILFNSDASFTAAFNGDSYQADGDSIEVMQFNSRTAQFELYDLTFPLQRDAHGHVQRPQKNPPLCLACHLENPRPIFSLAPHWQGFYGSNDDRLGADETSGYQAYQKNTGPDSRYHSLSPLGPTFMNREFTRRLGDVQARRAAQLLQSSRNFRRYSNLLLYGLKSCANAHPLREIMGDAGYSALVNRVKQDWRTDAGYESFEEGTWDRPFNLINGIFGIQDVEISLELASGDCTGLLHEGPETEGCIGRKIDEVSSIQDRVAALLSKVPALGVSCDVLAARLRSGHL